MIRLACFQIQYLLNVRKIQLCELLFGFFYICWRLFAMPAKIIAASKGTRRKWKIITLPTARAHFDSDPVLGFPAIYGSPLLPALIVVVVQKQIKIIRLISVFAYLVSVSLVAALLSAYYICIWNPRAANITIDTQTVNAERIMMALPTTGGEYVFDSTADGRYAGNVQTTVSIVWRQDRYNVSGPTYTRIWRTPGGLALLCVGVSKTAFFVAIKKWHFLKYIFVYTAYKVWTQTHEW